MKRQSQLPSSLTLWSTGTSTREGISRSAERKPNAIASTAAGVSPRGRASRDRRAPSGWLVDLSGWGSEGESPREDEAQESWGAPLEVLAVAALTGRGSKPLKRSRCGSNAHAPKAPNRHWAERDGLRPARWARKCDGQSRGSGRGKQAIVC